MLAPPAGLEVVAAATTAALLKSCDGTVREETVVLDVRYDGGVPDKSDGLPTDVRPRLLVLKS